MQTTSNKTANDVLDGQAPSEIVVPQPEQESTEAMEANGHAGPFQAALERLGARLVALASPWTLRKSVRNILRICMVPTH